MMNKLFCTFLIFLIALSTVYSYFSASELDLIVNVGKYEENLSITRIPDEPLSFEKPAQIGAGKLFLYRANSTGCGPSPPAILHLQYVENLENGEILQYEYIYNKTNEPIDIVTSSAGIFYIKIDTSKIGCGLQYNNSCPDGTSVGGCSIQQPLFCAKDMILINNPDLCGCDIFTIKNRNTCVPKLCQEGAYTHLQCSADGKIFAKVCEDGAWSQSKILFNCLSEGKSCVINEDDQPVCSVLFCDDGTRFGDCSKTNQYHICESQGRLRISPKCGCPDGQMASKNNKRCVLNYCEDGTQNYQCSKQKEGYYCMDGILFLSHSLCHGDSTDITDLVEAPSIFQDQINKNLSMPLFSPKIKPDAEFRALLFFFAVIVILAGFILRWWSWREKKSDSEEKFK